ncbi:cytochrome c [Variovorax sp. J22G73]|uniref:c-type cytochrome n=1 Tax=unclassified Variovorax TaxID=663243 RepID=UPI0025788AA6|nr:MULTISPECIES: cytochrome c [unclassified Variovorax]MDM0010777.1 cytochrome c [Variovorax sp. J22R203]MDM0103284.1 cytochrome c [Variovorax sp. J22G73]
MPSTPAPRDKAQQREAAEPVERTRPMPLAVAAVTLAVVVAGAAYIFFSEPTGPSFYGDRRTLADLRGTRAAQVGGAKLDGGQLFTTHCAACHQPNGQGLPGVFPPLDGSEWVRAQGRVIANILLHGVTGPLTVKGQNYSGSMPSFARLSDDELAAVASHVRGAWSNKALAVEVEIFATERKTSASRTLPFAGGSDLEPLLTK